MKFDLCFVSYNSEKWLEGCVKALANVDYDTTELGLYFADNASTDGTVAKLHELQKKYPVFGSFEVLEQGQNLGFGAGSNAAARAGHGDFVFFYNIDTEIFPDAFRNLEAAIRGASDKFGAFELRQFPYEHPKYYDPVTMEVSWSSGACFVLRRDVFEQTGGFDETIFMYAEDVELSWHIRALGYKIMYVPSAATWHYAYKQAGEEKPVQLAGSTVGNLVLRYKYGTQKDIDEGWRLYELISPRFHKSKQLEDVAERCMENLKQHKKEYRRFYQNEVWESRFKPTFFEMDYEFARAGAFYDNHLPKTQPEFTVIVRTFQRPSLLALTLKALTNQTYKHFKVIVVEDGTEEVSRSTAESFIGRLDITYIPAGGKVGRCKAGNIGIRNATTPYLCFLDDDDYFFADYMEVMACQVEEHPDDKFFCAASIQASTQVSKKDLTDFKFVQKTNLNAKNLRTIDFFRTNPVPIQAVVFHKSLFEQYGGLDENIDALEDWDMWMRYVCHTPIVSVDKGTSIFKVPADAKIIASRDRAISEERARLFERMKNYAAEISAQDVLSLFWTPADNIYDKADAAASEDEAEQAKAQHHEAELRRTVHEIQTSGIWRATALVRILPLALRILFSFAVTVLVGVLTVFIRILNMTTRILVKCEQKLRIGVNKIGPRNISADKARVDQMEAFVIMAKSSYSWKLGRSLQKLLGRR